MYQLMGGNMVRRVADGAVIPFADGNRDYRDYLAWVAQGNTPQPADPPPPPDTRRATALQTMQDLIDEPSMHPKLKQFAQALKAIV